jgi:cyclic beta-1,2-glucan synthetase
MKRLASIFALIFGIVAAAEHGIFTIGEASADAQLTDTGYRLSYDIPAGTAAGLWIKGLTAQNTLRVAHDAPADVRLKLELKGDIVITLPPQPEQLVDLDALGELREFVLVIEPGTAGGPPATGAFTFSAEFAHSEPPKPVPWYPGPGTIAIVFLLLAATRHRCAVAAAGASLLAFTGLAVWHQAPAFAALGGLILSALMHRRLALAIRDAAITFIFAISAGGLVIWQAPQPGLGLLKLSLAGGVASVAVYHLASCWRPLSHSNAMLLLLAPYTFGLLLLLQNLDDGGRILAICAFNVLVANGLSLLASRRLLRCKKTYRALLIVGISTILGPHIADAGSQAMEIPTIVHIPIIILCTVLSQLPLWAEVYLITGLLVDAMRGAAPTANSAQAHPMLGLRKGAVYSGVLITLLLGLRFLIDTDLIAKLPWTLWAAAAFPLIKTLVETFDGSQAFAGRLALSYRKPLLYVRGAALGLACDILARYDFVAMDVGQRALIGFAIGAIVYAGVNLLTRPAPRRFIVEALLGGFIGAAIGWYLDSSQVPVIVDKFGLYTSVGFEPRAFDIYALVNKWGHITLGNYSGGAKLLLNEAMLGVITWALAAWLFAINRAFLSAILDRDIGPIKRLASRDGFAELIEHSVFVLRWGLWMSPLIMTGLRQMADPTWYNQDGAIRSIIATVQQVRLDHAAFDSWSLEVFVCLLAYGWFRVIIWLDHMGLRVATLVNLSFLGMDKLDGRVARFLGPQSATARFIPEGVKRFTTWAPLLIPFYIPAGAAWDYAWTKHETLMAADSATAPGLAITLALSIGAGLLALCRRKQPEESHEQIILRPEGYDLTRRAYEGEPPGQFLFIDGQPSDYQVERAEDGRSEIWTVSLSNDGDEPQALEVVPYVEWVINKPEGDRGHTQYNRLFPEVEYRADLNAVFALHRYTKLVGVLAADSAVSGWARARVDFIGRAGSIRDPKPTYLPPETTSPCPTFDPIGALRLEVTVQPGESREVRILLGAADSREDAEDLLRRTHFLVRPPTTTESISHPIRHGAIPEGARPYYEFRDDGNTLAILTPYTPRPWDHLMSNALGHVMVVTNRGLHCSTSGNSQQNRLTADWADTTTRENASEVILFTVDGETYSPTFEPLRDTEAEYEARFSVDGTATFRMRKGEVSSELICFVPPDAPCGVYLLKVDAPGEVQVQHKFRICLADNPENAGTLKVREYPTVTYYENPRNDFRRGTAFVAHSAPNAKTFVLTLGQADSFREAAEFASHYSTLDVAESALQATRDAWLSSMSTLSLRTNHADFDHYQNWLKYQALAERIWARRGFYQSSGAFGFRDQLQDTVNLIWIDPSLARAQILLHAAQQFEEGDVVHWFFRLQDGRTGFACRSHAYDNLLWLTWGVVEYLRMTGDSSLLDERVPYLTSEVPLEPLPQGKHGMGFFPLRSTCVETVYQHCLRAFDCVFEHRLGPNGLPLIGAGDWNDGLDEIGSEGRGESTWLGFFATYILKQFIPRMPAVDGARYQRKLDALAAALESTWRDDRYLRAIHDEGSEIGVKDSGIWEIDALTAAWAVFADINPERSRIVFDTAIATLERDHVILLGWPSLREDSKPYLGRSSRYPEGVRENGMYCHGVQWLIRAARLLSERCAAAGDADCASHYRDTTYRLYRKIAAIGHMEPELLEIYGGQPNKQAADMLTTFDVGRMIWNGYTGAAAWMLRQACEGVVGAQLIGGELILPADFAESRDDLKINSLERSV